MVSEAFRSPGKSGRFQWRRWTDLAVATGGDSTVSVLLGNGNGTFKAAVNYGVDPDRFVWW